MDPQLIDALDWFSSARPPGGTECNYYARDNVKSFPKIPNGYNVKSFSQSNGCNVKSFSIKSNTNHLQTEVDGITNYFRSMTMNEIADEQHSYTNQSYLLDQTINKAAELLAKKECRAVQRRG